MKKLIKLILFIIIISIGWYFYTEIFTATAQDSEQVEFSITSGESVNVLANRLEEEGVIRSAWMFKKFITWKKIDRDIRQGTFTVERPITLARVVDALARPSVQERTITIIPGWDLRDIADYFEKEELFKKEDIEKIVGKSAVDYRNSTEDYPAQDEYLKYDVTNNKPWYVSFDGYLAPDTYRIFKDATLEDVIDKLIAERNSQFTSDMYRDIENSGRTLHDVITMASILEREVRREEDKKIVSDLFWRRYDMNWALQADSSVHYLTGKSGDVFTTKEDRESLSPWNTYKYPGLPIGPISNPSLESIMAAIYPTSNEYWYFLTTLDGEVKYAKTLEGHNANVAKYLR